MLAFLFCRIFQIYGLLKQGFFEALIPLCTKDALHDCTAILHLRKEKALKLSLRQENDLTKLFRIKADQLTNSI